jgi:hypothetical protein
MFALNPGSDLLYAPGNETFGLGFADPPPVTLIWPQEM